MRQPTSDANTNIGAADVLQQAEGVLRVMEGSRSRNDAINMLYGVVVQQNSVLKVQEQRIRQLEYVLELRSTP